MKQEKQTRFAMLNFLFRQQTLVNPGV